MRYDFLVAHELKRIRFPSGIKSSGEQAKPFERGGRGEREERQKNLKLSALFAPSAFNGLEDWAAERRGEGTSQIIGNG
jgi:hypothetical protein